MPDDRSWEKWFRVAQDDLICVTNNLNAPELPWTVIAFHSELAVEKYLKGYIAFNGERREKTHDLAALLQKAASFDTSLFDFTDDCEELSAYAIDARYPDVPDDYNEGVGRKAVEAAQRICQAISERIKAPTT